LNHREVTIEKILSNVYEMCNICCPKDWAKQGVRMIHAALTVKKSSLEKYPKPNFIKC